MKKNKKMPKIKKEIKDFLLGEEGKILKKDLAKVGMTLAALGLILHPSDASAQHYNVFYDGGTGGHSSHSSHASHASHSSHSSHSSHASHGNHSSGGWC